jgi:hypothetical protein
MNDFQGWHCKGFGIRGVTKLWLEPGHSAGLEWHEVGLKRASHAMVARRLLSPADRNDFLFDHTFANRFGPSL